MNNTNKMAMVCMLTGLGMLPSIEPRSLKERDKRTPADTQSRQDKNAAKRARRAARNHPMNNAEGMTSESVGKLFAVPKEIEIWKEVLGGIAGGAFVSATVNGIGARQILAEFERLQSALAASQATVEVLNVQIETLLEFASQAIDSHEEIFNLARNYDVLDIVYGIGETTPPTLTGAGDALSAE